MAPTGEIPTLSQVRNWDTTHLTEAATHWTKTATTWEDCFTRFAEQIRSPGGIPWEGDAAEAAQQLAYSDRMTVIGLADQLHSASGIARTGATQLDECCRVVLRTADAAEGAGFTVGEDFSVSDSGLYDAATAAARQAQAEAFAADLRATVGTLVATDGQIASQLLAATAGLGSDVFPESDDPAGAQGPEDQKAVTNKLLDNLASGEQSAPLPPDTMLGYLAAHPAPPSNPVPPKKPFSWQPSPTDLTTATAAGIASASHEGALLAAGKSAAADDPVVKWTKDLKVKGVEVPGFTKVGGVMALATAPMSLITDYAEAREAGASKWAAAGQAVVREGAANGAGLFFGSIASGIAADAAAGAAIGSIIPGAGTAAGLVAGVVFGGLTAFGASKAVAWAFS